MINIIDANNLAGKLGLLGESNFDQKLIRLLANYKKSKYILVFDGRDNVGDKYVRENITVIYTPKDSYYKSADDKIIELAEDYLESDEEVKLITDDLEIIKKVQKIIDDKGAKIIFEKASRLAEKINDYIKNKQEEKRLDDREINNINSEFLNTWK